MTPMLHRPFPIAFPTAFPTAALAATLALTGCASAPPVQTPQAVVTRTASSTVWALPEALAAAEAAARAQEAAAAAARRPAEAPRAAAVAGASTAPAAAAALPTPPASPSPSPSPSPSAATAAVAVAGETVPPAVRALPFAFDSDVLEPGVLALLQAHAAGLKTALQARPVARLVVEGHADERGGSEYNLALGQRRAEAVVQALVRLGLASARLEAVSFGEARPADPARTPAAWATNRRAELRLR